MAIKRRMPRFRTEKEEAAWWDAHPEVITELFVEAKKKGRIKMLPLVEASARERKARRG